MKDVSRSVNACSLLKPFERDCDCFFSCWAGAVRVSVFSVFSVSVCVNRNVSNGLLFAGAGAVHAEEDNVAVTFSASYFLSFFLAAVNAGKVGTQFLVRANTLCLPRLADILSFSAGTGGLLIVTSFFKILIHRLETISPTFFHRNPRETLLKFPMSASVTLSDTPTPVSMHSVTQTIWDQWIVPALQFEDVLCPEDLGVFFEKFKKMTPKFHPSFIHRMHAFSILYLLGLELHMVPDCNKTVHYADYEKALSATIVEKCVTDDAVLAMYCNEYIHPLDEHIIKTDISTGSVYMHSSGEPIRCRIPCTDVHIDITQEKNVFLATNATILTTVNVARKNCISHITKNICREVTSVIGQAAKDLQWEVTEYKRRGNCKIKDDMTPQCRYAQLILNATAKYSVIASSEIADIEDMIVPDCMRSRMEALKNDSDVHLNYSDRLYVISFLRALHVPEQTVTKAVQANYIRTTESPSASKLSEIETKYLSTYSFRKSCADCKIHISPLSCAQSSGIDMKLYMSAQSTSSGIMTPIEMTHIFNLHFKPK